jgi:PAS domain S-box-containing protein
MVTLKMRSWFMSRAQIKSGMDGVQAGSQERLTVRRQAEQEIQWLARFPDENPTPLFRVRRDGVVLYANKAGRPLLGLWKCEIGERLPEKWSALMREVFEDGQGREVEVGYEERVFSLAVTPIREAGYLNVYGLDITERKRAEDQLRKLSRAVEQSPSTVVITNTIGEIEYVNPKFAEITGYLPEEVLGLNPRILKSGEQASDYYRELWDTVLDGSEWRGEFSNRRKDGRVYWESASISPIKNSYGEVTHFVKVAEDVTEQKRADAELRKYAAELEARNEELDAFAHTVAHDLKNPLNLIVGFAELLEADLWTAPDAETRQYLGLIARSGRKMNNIIEELLLLAGVRKVDAPLAPVDMAEVVVEAQHRVVDMVEETKAVVVEPDVWPVAMGYAPWVEEVWVNYLSNALKYGGRPPRVELGAQEQADGMLLFWVRDNGPGLGLDDQAQLFAPFKKLDQTRAQGHGLGLSIVRRIIQKLGGEVGVESGGIEGQGCTFYFTLPGVPAEGRQ